MALKGHGSELPLVDIVQASAMARRTCRLKVRGIDLAGELYLQNGRVIHATYGELRGAPAFFTMVTDDYVLYHMQSGVDAPEKTIDGSIEELLMEAMRRKDESGVHELSLDDMDLLDENDERGSLGAVDSASSGERGAPGSGQPSAQAADQVAGKGRPTVAIVIAVVVALLGAGFGGWYAMALRSGSQATADGSAADTEGSRQAVAATVEATDLNGPNDVQPKLQVGTPPPAPRSDMALRPTIVCRLLVDTDGRVIEQQVYRPRPELAEFEKVALDAVASYRFSPAQRGPVPVRVWINYPVTFRQR